MLSVKALFVERGTAVRNASAAKPSVSENELSLDGSVGGQSDAKAAVLELVTGAFYRSEAYSRFGLRPPRGLLLHGPPGTGKTLLVRSVAAAIKCTLIARTAADIVGKYYGESEARLRQLFADAEAQAPAIIFLDEIDALCPKRDEVRPFSCLFFCFLTFLE